ncbi:MAG: NTP transferase domain-containing protein [Bacteroidota bacterium]
MENKIPILYGLVLGGGKSTRMGADKRLLKYHNKSQQGHTYYLLSKVCKTVFLSIREDQKSSAEKGFNCITDENKYEGPFNGILSAHAKYPDVAWLVLACDLPLMDLDTINALVLGRRASASATSMAAIATKMPEPMATIWEPTGLEKAKEYLKTTNNSSLRKFLLNSEVRLVYPKTEDVLFNANSQEDFKQAKTHLKLAQNG